jgi:hypothetical protein
MAVPLRVAVPKTRFQTDISETMNTEALQKVIQFFGNTILADKIADELAVIEAARLEGPGWKTVTCTETDAALLEDNARRLVPIKGTNEMAFLPQWHARCVKMMFLEDEDAEVPVFEVELDSEDDLLHVRLEASRSSFRVKIPSLAIAELVNILADVKTPDAAFPEIDRSPAQAFKQSKGKNDERFQGHETFALPAFVGEAAVRFFSTALRMHVLLHSSLEEGVSRPMALDGCYLSRLPGNGDRHTSKTRVSFNFHRASCRCMCGFWHGGTGTLGTPRKLGAVLEFCGHELVDGVCPIHIDTVCKRVNTGVNKGVCTANMKLFVTCSHSAAAPKSNTVIPMPSTHEFLNTLAASCASLCSPDVTCSQEDTDAVLAALGQAFNDFSETNTHNTNADNLVQTDDIIRSMLCSGAFYYGAKRKNGKAKLHCRDGASTPVAALVRAADTHSHLLPPK